MSEPARPAEDRAEPRAEGLGAFRVFYFFYYAAGSSLAPYLALHYRARGLPESLIGVLAAVPPTIALFGAAFWGGLADSTRSHGRVLALTIAGAMACAAAIGLSARFALLLAVVTAYAFFLAPIVPLADNMVLTRLGSRSERYGRIRVWGAAGWGAVAPGVGALVDRWGLAASFASYLAFMAVCLAIAFGVPAGALPPVGRYWTRLRDLLARGGWIVFLGLLLACGMGLATVHSYLFLYMSDMGAHSTVMGVSLAVATLSELVVFMVSDRLLAALGATRLLLLGIAATIVRLALYSIVREPSLVLAVQLLHGLSFSATWVAAVSFAHRMAPPGLGATAQALVGGVTFGVSAAAGAAIGGLLYQAGGPFFMYRWAAIGLLAVTVLSLLAPAVRRPAS